MDRDFRSEEAGSFPKQRPALEPGEEGAAGDGWRAPFDPPEFVLVGRVAAAHGIRGEVRVVPIETDVGRLLELEDILLRPPGRAPGSARRRYRVMGARPHRGGALLALEGVHQRSEAEALRGWLVEVRGGQVKPLPQGHYYVFELVGCTVYTVDGREMGTVKDVLPTGANDVYVVEDARGRDILIPAVQAMVKAVDVEARRIVVDPWPGLWDDGEPSPDTTE